MVPAALSLEQLRIFVLTVDEGSFSAAARHLSRAQSVVTYAIQALEAATGLPLFDRAGYRPQLTEAGRALLPRARRLLQDAAAFQAQAQALADGLEPELTLVVDSMFPMGALTQGLLAFQAQFPSVRTHLHVESLGAAADMVAEGRADLGLAVAMFIPPEGLERRASAQIALAPVCAPFHPLAQRQAQTIAPLTPEAVGEHIQLVLVDRSFRTQGREYGVEAVSTWRLADLGAKHAMLRAGLGWGSLPRHMAADDLEAGRLVELRVERWGGSHQLPRLETALIRRTDQTPGPAARWLFDRLAATNGDR